MKTAMQKLIETMDYSIENSKDDYKIMFRWIKFHAQILLEQEKEQIRLAFFRDGHEYWDNITFEEYYNQTYNKNK